MNKPDEIPQGVWDIATSIDVMDESVCDWDYNLAIDIAQAIMRERERCAVIAEGRHKVWGTYEQTVGIEVEDDISACLEIATAIRGGEK